MKNISLKKSKITCAVLIGAMLPLAAFANECQELWVERNTIYYENGYCFTSDLGRDYFGNANCYTSDPALSDYEKRRVALIRSREQDLHCDVQKQNWVVN